MSSGRGPWQPDEVLPLVDFSADAPWHGGPQPPPIRPASNPGGLVAVLLDADDRERRRWLLTKRRPEAGVDAAAAACAEDPTLRLVLYDGDHGHPIVVMRTG